MQQADRRNVQMSEQSRREMRKVMRLFVLSNMSAAFSPALACRQCCSPQLGAVQFYTGARESISPSGSPLSSPLSSTHTGLPLFLRSAPAHATSQLWGSCSAPADVKQPQNSWRILCPLKHSASQLWMHWEMLRSSQEVLWCKIK